MKWTETNGALKACRTAAGLSQEELANRLGLSQAWVSKIENGRGEPSMSLAAAWIDACGAGSLELLIGPDAAEVATLFDLMRRSPEAAAIVRALLVLGRQ